MTAEEFQRLRGPNDLTEPPRVVLKVRRATEPWLDYLTRVVDHLRANVSVVLLADEVSSSVSVYRPDHPPKAFEKNETVTIPDVLPGLEVPVARFLE